MNRIKIGKSRILKQCLMLGMAGIMLASGTLYAKSETKDGIDSFPESYRSYLNEVKQRHPNWNFKSVHTNVDWNTAVAEEAKGTKSLIPASYPDKWKENNTQIEPGWVCASDAAIRYCLDPRNFLSDENIFQFDTTKYNPSVHTDAAVTGTLAGTPMGEGDKKDKYQYQKTGNWLNVGCTYAQLIVEKGREKNVSPVHLASRIRQETGGDLYNNRSIYGIYPGLEGFYNFFNIKASGSNPVYAGLTHAKSNGWSNPNVSIQAGATKIYDDYVKYGQNTVYFEKWDVNDETGGQSLFWHQYMSNILAPTSESSRMYTAYKKAGMLEASFDFYIPVYLNMPSSAAGIIDGMLSIDLPNNGDSVTGSDLNVVGWILCEDSNASVKIYVDGVESSATITRGEREDVLNAISGYGGREKNPRPGYYATVNTTGLKSGDHTLTIEMVDGNGTAITSQSRTFRVNNPNTKLCIDSPQNNAEFKNVMQVHGWVLSEDAGATVKVFVDNQEQSGVARWARDDLSSMIDEYGGVAKNPKPGYVIDIDTNHLTYGNHLVRVEVLSSSGVVIAKEERVVNIKEYNTKISLDSPQETEVVSDSQTILSIFGWTLCEDSSATTKVYVDGKDVGSVARFERPDLDFMVDEYGGVAANPKPGFVIDYDITSLDFGVHTIKVEVISGKGKSIISQERTFEIKKSVTTMNLDQPSVNANVFETGFQISGWVLSESDSPDVLVYVDGKEIPNVARWARDDLDFMVGNYGGKDKNKEPGFVVDYNSVDLSYGTHSVKAVVKTKAGRILDQREVTVNMKAIESKIAIDVPQINGRYKTDMQISGWLLSEDKNAQVRIYINDQEVPNVSRWERSDVYSVGDYGGKEKNPEPGYVALADTSQLKDGNYTVKVEGVSGNGKVLISESRNVTIRKYDSKLSFDAPQDNQVVKETMQIVGWALSDDAGATVKAYINNEEVTNMARWARDDLDFMVGDYGGKDKNKEPGFVADIDNSKRPDGTYKVKVELVSSTGDILETQERTITLKKYDSKLSFDAPQNGQTVKTSMQIVGWALCNDAGATVKAYIDDKEVTNMARWARDDLDFMVGDYGGKDKNKEPGFVADIDNTTLKDGSHKVKVQVVASSGEVLETQERTIQVQKYNTKLCIDSPQVNQSFHSTQMQAFGWVLSEDKNAKVKIYVDNKEISGVSRWERSDVYSVQGYGGKDTNPTPGYIVDINLTPYNEGTHAIKIEVVSKTGEILASETRNVRIGG